MPPWPKNTFALSPQMAQKSHSHNRAAVENNVNPIMASTVGMSSQWAFKYRVPRAGCRAERDPATQQPSNPATSTAATVTNVQGTCNNANTNITAKTPPLPYKNARPRSFGPRSDASIARATVRPNTVIERIATMTAVIPEGRRQQAEGRRKLPPDCALLPSACCLLP